MNDDAATFTMTLCSRDRSRALDLARESFEWYPAKGARLIASLTDWMAEQKQDLGNYSYAADMKSYGRPGNAGPADASSTWSTRTRASSGLLRSAEHLQALRGSRHRHPSVPGQSLSDTSRSGHGDHRAHGQRGNPEVRPLIPGRNGLRWRRTGYLLTFRARHASG